MRHDSHSEHNSGNSDSGSTNKKESGVDSRLWWSHRGVKVSDECGVLVAGMAMVFSGVSRSCLFIGSYLCARISNFTSH